MIRQILRYIFLIFFCNSLSAELICQDSQTTWMNEKGFVFLDEVLTQTQFDVRYAGYNNFIGRPVDGYHSKRLVMTGVAATALHTAERHLNELGYGLKIFDTYRPQRAVEHFKKWSENPADTIKRSIFYPEQDKQNLFNLGYISTRSGHSRGSTIDLTLYHLESGKEVDMGGPYDYFGIRSHHDFQELTYTQKRHRELLKSVLSQFGFRPYIKEWWHYTLRNEPYPETYFNEVVK